MSSDFLLKQGFVIPCFTKGYKRRSATRKSVGFECKHRTETDLLQFVCFFFINSEFLSGVEMGADRLVRIIGSTRLGFDLFW